MTTTQTHAVTGLPTVDHVGAPIAYNIDSAHRTGNGLALRNAGHTWQEIALRLGYSSAGRAEYGVMRYVAWLNGNHNATPRRRPTTAPSWNLNRSFGVEVEFVGITRSTAARALTELLGYEVPTNNYHQSQGDHTRGREAYTGWTVEHDGSVMGRNGGGEAVSPVLSGRAGMTELKNVMEALRFAGARVSVRTGMHVHVDARDLTGEQIARLICAYADRQELFDNFVSPSRRSTRYNEYCRVLGDQEKADIEESFTAHKCAPRYAARYRTVNCTSYGIIGTIEFRQHQGSLNGPKALAWIETLLALVNTVLDTKDEALHMTDAKALIDEIGAYGMSRAAMRQMKARVA